MATVRGDVIFQAGDKSITMRFGVNALLALEQKLDKKVTALVADLQGNPDLGVIRTMFWAGLLKSQPEITEDQAGDVMDDLGLQRAVELVGEAFVAAFPPADGAAENPPKAPTKTA